MIVAAGSAGSRAGRNGLGRTSALTADVAGDWSARRCGLNPMPMSSTATTTRFSLSTTGATVVVVTVGSLSTGGGGSAVHPARSKAATPTAVARRAVERTCIVLLLRTGPLLRRGSCSRGPYTRRTTRTLRMSSEVYRAALSRDLLRERSRARSLESRCTLRTRTTSGVTSTHSSPAQNSIAISRSSFFGFARVSITSAED